MSSSLLLCALAPLEHRDNGTDRFKLAQLLGRNVEKRVTVTRIIFAALGKTATDDREPSERSAELLKQVVDQAELDWRRGRYI